MGDGFRFIQPDQATSKRRLNLFQFYKLMLTVNCGSVGSSGNAPGTVALDAFIIFHFQPVGSAFHQCDTVRKNRAGIVEMLFQQALELLRLPCTHAHRDYYRLFLLVSSRLVDHISREKAPIDQPRLVYVEVRRVFVKQ